MDGTEDGRLEWSRIMAQLVAKPWMTAYCCHYKHGPLFIIVVLGQNSIQNWQNKSLCTKEAFWMNMFKLFWAIQSCVGATSSILSQSVFFLATNCTTPDVFTLSDSKYIYSIYKSTLIKTELSIQYGFKLTFSSILWRKSEGVI